MILRADGHDRNSRDHMNRTIVIRDGRTLGYAEYGDLAGKAVFHFNGSGGSRLERPTNESILTDLGIRFISTDRPGHGLSICSPIVSYWIGLTTSVNLLTISVSKGSTLWDGQREGHTL
jgi:hypothetical protein